jgi:hypothetical protein
LASILTGIARRLKVGEDLFVDIPEVLTLGEIVERLSFFSGFGSWF